MPLTLKDASGADVQVPTAEEIAEMITGATRAQIEKANKKLATDLTKSSSEAMLAALEEYETKRAAAPPGAAATDPGSPAKPSPEMSAMAKRLEDAEKAIKTANDAREAAETRQRNDSTRASITSLLGPHIRPEALKVITDHLFQNSVEFDESNTPLFKLRKAAVAGMAEEDVRLPLDAGIREFLKTKDAEWLIPQRQPQQKPGARMPGAAGSSQLPKYDQPATTDDEKIRRAMEREQVVKAQLGI